MASTAIRTMPAVAAAVTIGLVSRALTCTTGGTPGRLPVSRNP